MLSAALWILWAQWTLRPAAPVVTAPTGPIPNAWAGGFNAPQFSTLDIDGDGVAELFVFDRSDNRMQLYRRVGNDWIWLPGADTLFPTQALDHWVLLRDYDGDGDKDLFTSVISNIRCFRNTAPPGTPPQWQLAYDTLTSDYFGYRTYLYSGSVDIPALVDVDGDGDLDFLVYEVLGALIEWHKNEGIELLGRSDTLLLRLQSSCWGHVYEVYDYQNNQFTFQPYFCGSGQREAEDPSARIQHAGGTLLAIDLNGDGLKDVIVGDDGPPYLIAGINSGTPQIAHIDPNSALAPYPVSAPAYMPSFPATFFEDVTGDGKPDLIVANNSPFAGRDTGSIWMYENIGRIDSPAWAAPVRSWLQNTHLDLGTAAHPTLADLNRDGYPDLILSCESFFTDTGPKAGAWLLWGNATGFTLANSNWLDLPQYTLRNPIFAAGDINGNGRTDLLMGTSTGALWHWEENTAGGVDFALVTQNFAGISGPAFAAPLLYDYDSDGDLDLILGGRNGRLALYRQDAGGSFTLVTDFLGQIELRDTISTLLGFTRPALADLDRNGTPELIVGNLTGFVRVYGALWGQPQAAWPLLADLPYHWGKRASPTTWQSLDSLLLLIGNLRGGVHAFTLQTTGGTTPSALPHAPVKPYLRTGAVLFSTDWIEASLYDASGRQVAHIAGQGTLHLPFSETGLYFLHLRSRGQSYTEKVFWLSTP